MAAALRIRTRHLRRRDGGARRRRRCRTRRCCATSSRRPCSPTGSGLDFFGIGEHHRARVRRLRARGRARRDRRPHRADPPRLGRDRAELRRPRARLPALRHARRTVGRPRRGDPRARLVHRVVPAVRLRARASTRSSSRRSSTSSPRCCRRSPSRGAASCAPPLTDQLVYPPVEHGRLKTWVGVGGSPESVVRAAHYGLPLVLAIIGGSPARFAPLADLYRRALAQFGHPQQPVAIHSPGFIADTDAEALDVLWPHYKVIIDRIGTRARLGPGHARALRGRGRPERRALRGLARDRRAEDRRGHAHDRRVALRPEVLERHPAARGDDGQHRALRHQVVPRVRELLAAADAADAELDAVAPPRIERMPRPPAEHPVD